MTEAVPVGREKLARLISDLSDGAVHLERHARTSHCATCHAHADALGAWVGRLAARLRESDPALAQLVDADLWLKATTCGGGQSIQ